MSESTRVGIALTICKIQGKHKVQAVRQPHARNAEYCGDNNLPWLVQITGLDEIVKLLNL